MAEDQTITDELRKAVKKTLTEVESRAEPLSEREVGAAIRRLIDNEDVTPKSMEWLAETMAFTFLEDYGDRDEGWGTYFGPTMVLANADGSRSESPSIKMITVTMLDYWAMRARAAKHPIFKARYSGLVWDFALKITGKSPPVEMAQIRIDSVIEAVLSSSHKHETDAIAQLAHALKLAISLNDPHRIERTRDAVLEYGDRVGKDEKQGLWCFVYDLLLDQKKVPLTTAQRVKIINDLEGRLLRLSDTSASGSPDPWAAEDAAVRLARHYRAEGKRADIRRVLLMYGSAFEKMAASATGMLAQAWLQRVHQIYRVYRDFGLQDDSERLLRSIHELGPKMLNDMKPLTTQMNIPKERMDAYVQETTDGNLETALERIAVHYVPRKGQVEKQVRDLAARVPLIFLVETQLVDHKGRPTASIGPLSDDIDGRIVMQTAQNLHFEAVFLREVMVALIRKFSLTHQSLTEYVYRSPLFDEDNRAIVERGMKAYLEGDSLVAIHVLVPQIENALRKLVELNGGTVLKPNPFGGMDCRVFDELLRDDRLLVAFGGFAGDVTSYLRVLFTERRGINLRNRMCHGIAPASMFDLAFADRVLHALLVLALVRKKNEPASSPESTA